MHYILNKLLGMLENQTEWDWWPLKWKTVHNCSLIGCPASCLCVLEISMISQERWGGDEERASVLLLALLTVLLGLSF